MKISVIIATYNRSDKIADCISSILANDFKDFEIIIIDQSKDDKTKKIVEHYKSDNLILIKRSLRGWARALNYGIAIASGEIVAFTDDDCLVEKTWLKNINSSFKNHSKISAIFGQTLLYKPLKHKNLLCPSTVIISKNTFIKYPSLQFNIGCGNNMAFRKLVFRKIGYFKSWIGPGSLGLSGSDTEIITRLLFKKYTIFRDPNIIVYHNRWLNNEEYKKQLRRYNTGGIALSFYYARHNYKPARDYLIWNLQDSKDKIKGFIIGKFRNKTSTISLRDINLEIVSRLYGFVWGCLMNIIGEAKV